MLLYVVELKYNVFPVSIVAKKILMWSKVRIRKVILLLLHALKSYIIVWEAFRRGATMLQAHYSSITLEAEFLLQCLHFKSYINHWNVFLLKGIYRRLYVPGCSRLWLFLQSFHEKTRSDRASKNTFDRKNRNK